MLKDLGLAMDAANKMGAETPLGARATEVYQDMVDAGYGGKDFSVAYQYLDDK